MKVAISVLNALPKTVVVGISAALVAAIGFLDYSLPVEVSLLIFYLVPVAIATWFVGVRPGFLMAFLSGIAVFCGQMTVPPLKVELSLWNAVVAGLVGSIAADLVHRVKIASEIESQLGRTDASTGAINQRFFMELLEAEFNRAQRYRFPLTLVRIELENFEEIDRRIGSSLGDELLYQFVEQLSEALRANDVVARLDDNEFAIILPQTDDNQAQQALSRIFPPLQEVLESGGTPLEYIFGVVTFLDMPEDFATLNDETEKLVRQIKANGQSRLVYKVFP
ncbi:GGDEF domain-containing protein [Altericista sp. CCNU0014]|uniref:GGDEF domain-containing protein n=1 Tax=Altericista sp. CCNU0014 TaxID=3082949 RepID=UPI00384D53F9